MISFLIMLYLAFTLYVTIAFIFKVTDVFIATIISKTVIEYPYKVLALICLLWSIWYMYLIN